MKRQVFILIIVASTIFTTVRANQGNLETWECKELSLAAVITEQVMTVKATSNSALEKGTVSVSGLKYDSNYEVQGFLRIWSINRKEGFDILVINPNNMGQLYLNMKPEDLDKDSSELSPLTLSCKKVK